MRRGGIDDREEDPFTAEEVTRLVSSISARTAARSAPMPHVPSQLPPYARRTVGPWEGGIDMMRIAFDEMEIVRRDPKTGQTFRGPVLSYLKHINAPSPHFFTLSERVNEFGVTLFSVTVNLMSRLLVASTHIQGGRAYDRAGRLHKLEPMSDLDFQRALQSGLLHNAYGPVLLRRPRIETMSCVMNISGPPILDMAKLREKLGKNRMDVSPWATIWFFDAIPSDKKRSVMFSNRDGFFSCDITVHCEASERAAICSEATRLAWGVGGYKL